MKIREVSSAEFNQPLDRAEGEREKFNRNQWIKKHIETVANGITDMIKAGYQPYKNSLSGGIANMPHNAATKHIYRGLNAFSLRMESLNRGFTDMRFITLNQCNKMGGHVKKGQTGFKILQPKMITKHCKLQGEPTELDKVIIGKDGQQYTEHNYTVFNIKTVFNVKQTTLQLPSAVSILPCEWEANDFFEKFMQAASIPVREGDSQAFYDPNQDQIIMPQKAMFGSPDLYYGTLLHEFYHATGHVSRENRLCSNDTFGSPEYAREEVRAEIFACLCANAFGLDMPHTSSVTYIDNWLKDRDSKEILRAATEAEDIFRIIVSVAHGQQPDRSWFPDRSLWPAEMPVPLGYVDKPNNIPLTEQYVEVDDTPSLVGSSSAHAQKTLPPPTPPVLSEKSAHGDIPLAASEAATLQLQNWLTQHDYSNPPVLITTYDSESSQWEVLSPAAGFKHIKLNTPLAKFENVASMLQAFDAVGLKRPTILAEIPHKWDMPEKVAITPFMKLKFNDGTIGGTNGYLIDITQFPRNYAKHTNFTEEFQGQIDSDTISLGQLFKLEHKKFTKELSLDGLFYYNSERSPCVMAYTKNAGVAMDFTSTQYFKATHGNDIHFFCDSSKTSEQIAKSPLLVRRETGEVVGVVMPVSMPEGLEFMLCPKDFKELQRQTAAPTETADDANTEYPHVEHISAEETFSPTP